MRYEAFPALGDALPFEDAVTALRQRFPQAHGDFRLPRGASITHAVLEHHLPHGHGVYIIQAAPTLPEGAFYIGRSGTISNAGVIGWQTLPERLTKKQAKGEAREAFFKRRMDELDLEGLDITWALTLAGGAGVLPALVEAWLLQAHLTSYGRLPLENRSA